MQWDSLHDFFAMGGYAFYVWGAFGLTALLLAWELYALKLRWSRLVQQAGQPRQEAAGDHES